MEPVTRAAGDGDGGTGATDD
ncbi:unnamed protein product, partial [Rotaria magnacalcarata]